MRAKGLQYEGVEAHQVNQQQRRDSDNYVAARNEGMQPEGVARKHVDFARRVTEMTGTPYRADQQ